jgi:Leucine rich repeat
MLQQPQNSAWSEADAQARIEAARRDGATALDLSGLRLRALPESVLDLPRLRELRLNNNRLRDVPAMIRRLPDLTGLDLSDNLILELPDWLGELRDLTELNVSGNQLLGVKNTPAKATRASRSRLLPGFVGDEDIPAGRLQRLSAAMMLVSNTPMS